MAKKMTKEEFVEKARRIHGDLYDYSNVDYINSRTNIKIICGKCNLECQTMPTNHLSGKGCFRCNRNKNKMTTEIFISKAKQKHGNKYNYDKVHYVNNVTKIIVYCNKCKSDRIMIPTNHLKGVGCPKCRPTRISEKRMSVDIFESRCKKRHNSRYQYFGDYIGLSHPIKFYCTINDKHYYQNAGYHLHSFCCPKNELSKGEYKIASYFKRNSIEYEYEKVFSKCKLKRCMPFDFYLSKFNLCIEYDGLQHYCPTGYYGGKEKLEITQRCDNFKNDFCKEYGIKLLRIPYFEFKKIDHILTTRILKERYEQCLAEI